MLERFFECIAVNTLRLVLSLFVVLGFMAMADKSKTGLNLAAPEIPDCATRTFLRCK